MQASGAMIRTRAPRPAPAPAPDPALRAKEAKEALEAFWGVSRGTGSDEEWTRTYERLYGLKLSAQQLRTLRRNLPKAPPGTTVAQRVASLESMLLRLEEES